jgi:hypothetical protein
VPADERRWLLAILITAIVVRVLVVAGLFISTDHAVEPFRTFFGDEEAFLRRAIWKRNLALDIPVHRADVIYAFDRSSRTSYVYLSALIQMAVGPAPYAMHLVSILCFIGAAVILHRLVRPSFGRLPSLLGLAALLFLPSLFAWSVSALKEPLYWLVLCVGLAGAVDAARATGWRRLGGLVVVGLAAYAAQTVRDGGLLMAGVGGAAGVALGIAATRPRLAVAATVAAIAIAALVLSRGVVQDRVVTGVRQVAGMHWDAVNTPGYVYTILDDDFYRTRSAVGRMTLRQGAQYVAGALARYVTVPVPWQLRSRTALSFLPEQIVWWAMVLLVPIGAAVALRRDAVLTMVLSAYAAAAVVVVALTSGNIGTLVRHRGLAIPYLIWFSVLGACELLAAWCRTRERIS